MKKVIWGMVILLLILHQDNWLWENTTLVFGFMPIGLLYHAGISMVAAFTWFLATQFAWPEFASEEAAAEPTPSSSQEGAAQ
jgi:hypothetical protein